MSSSAIEREGGILDYARERFPATLFVPVAVFLAAPALPSGWAAFAKAVLLAFALVLQFRLWDDLNDRERDRVAHPERVLARAESLAPFRALLAALTIVVVLLLTLRLALPYLTAVGALALWYRWIAPRVPEAIGYHVVLLKYPLFSYLAAGGPLASMALVYSTFVVYEPLHDRSTARLPRVRAALAVEVFLWVALVIVVAARSAVPLWAASFLALGAVVAAMFGLRRFWTSSDGALAGRAVFLVSLACLLSAHGARG